MTTIRTYQPEDALALLELFRDTVRRVNCRDYSPEQIQAWASDEIDPKAWAERFEDRFAIVAEMNGTPVGFTDMQLDGHIDRFYVSADHQGQGVGRRMLGAIVLEAQRAGLRSLTVEASITARPFFEAQKFVVQAEQTVTCRSVAFVNYRMQRSL